jgi:hypothetical protein
VLAVERGLGVAVRGRRHGGVEESALRGLGSVPVDNDAARGLSMLADPSNETPAKDLAA